MKSYDKKIYRQHLSEVPKSEDPFAMETYMRGVVDIANGFNTNEQAIGILDKNDLVQECYYILIKTWNGLDLNAIQREAKEPQAFIWHYLKKTIKIQARDWIHSQKDGQRIPKNKRWEIAETKNVDDFLTQLFPQEWFAENAEAMDLIEYGYNTRYDIEQLGLAFEDVFRNALSEKETLVIKMFFGLDTDKLSSKEIAKRLNISVSNVNFTKHHAIQKLKTQEVKNYLQEFYDFI